VSQHRAVEQCKCSSRSG